MLDISGGEEVKRRALLNLFRQIRCRAEAVDDANPRARLELLSQLFESVGEIRRRSDIDLSRVRLPAALLLLPAPQPVINSTKRIRETSA